MVDLKKKSERDAHKEENLANLEARIARIEAHLKLKPLKFEDEEEPYSLIPENLSDVADSLELRIGQYWFAKTGIVVLAIGIAFLMTFPYKDWPSFLPSLIGYALVGGIFTISYLGRKSFEYLSRYLLGGGLVLTYFATMRLHYFSNQPTLENKSWLVILLLIVVIFSLTVSNYRKSIYLTGLSLTLGYVTACIGDSAYPFFMILATLSTLSVYFRLKYKWEGLFIYAIILTYFFHFIWFINNPFLGKPIQLVTFPKLNIIFIIIYATIFALGNLLRKKEIPENNIVIASGFLNCFGSYGLYLIVTATKISDFLFSSHLIISFVFLTLSILFWIRERSKYSTFFYAILGYTALSVAIIAQFKIPDAFIWLCWQSLLVIITSLWFRSKIIVLANFVIFLIIFLAYLSSDVDVGPVSLSFGVVALLSARIMNWQKHRLELKTEFMRNAYLTTAFIMIPYALYHSVPKAFISLSWVGAAIFYYLLNIILKNKKYRWMALFTLLLTVVYILIIGIIKLEPVYRIISFIVLGLVLIITSIFYTRIRLKSSASESKEEKSA